MKKTRAHETEVKVISAHITPSIGARTYASIHIHTPYTHAMVIAIGWCFVYLQDFKAYEQYQQTRARHTPGDQNFLAADDTEVHALPHFGRRPYKDNAKNST
jgi:hypothetical protein